VVISVIRLKSKGNPLSRVLEAVLIRELHLYCISLQFTELDAILEHYN